jgi:hypothetical protein
VPTAGLLQLLRRDPDLLAMVMGHRSADTYFLLLMLLMLLLLLCLLQACCSCCGVTLTFWPW